LIIWSEEGKDLNVKRQEEHAVGKECWWHKWEVVKDTGKHRYFECAKCGRRKVSQVFTGGYQPIDEMWLKRGKSVKSQKEDEQS